MKRKDLRGSFNDARDYADEPIYAPLTLIERLEEANQHLVGAKEHHDAIREALALVSLADRIVHGLLPVMEAARPLVMNLENLKDYKELRR